MIVDLDKRKKKISIEDLRTSRIDLRDIICASAIQQIKDEENQKILEILNSITINENCK